MINEIKAEHRATFDANRTLRCDCGWTLENVDKPLIELNKHQQSTSKLPHGIYVLDAPTSWIIRCTCGWTATQSKIVLTLSERLQEHQQKTAKLPKGAKRRYR